MAPTQYYEFSLPSVALKFAARQVEAWGFDCACFLPLASEMTL